jgi:hypothetical protein
MMQWFTHRRLVALFLLWVAGAGLYLAWHDSLTTDEGIHTASAYLAMTRGEYRFDPECPYLFKEFSALPLLVMRPHLPPDDKKLWSRAYPTLYDSWWEAREWTNQWFYKSGNNAREMVFLMRIPAVLCLVTLCWMAYFLTSLWFSPKVGLYALIFTAFNPTLLANGHLANTDVPVALTALFLLYGVWRYSQKPTTATAILVGLLSAVALCTKHSAVSFVPVIALFILLVPHLHNESNSLWWKRSLPHLILIAFVAWVGIWAFYGFRSHPQFNSHFVSHILPIDYVKGLILVGSSAGAGRWSYLFGHWSKGGLWYYFPTIFTLKTPLIVLLLLIIGLGMCFQDTFASLRQKKTVPWLLTIFAVVYALISIVNKLNLGIRHIAPLMPLVSMAAALVLVKLADLSDILLKGSKRWFTGAVFALAILPVIFQFNSLLGFSNLLVEPRSKAYWYFDDSNLDWGNFAQQTADFAHKTYPGQTIYSNKPWNPYALAYFGLDAHSYDPANPPHSGILILTGTELAQDRYANYRSWLPDASIGNTVFFYRLQ